METTLTHTTKRQRLERATETDRRELAPVVVSAVEALDEQIQKAASACGVAVREAMIAGQMLLELRARMLAAEKQNNQHTPADLRFKACLEEAAKRNGVSERNLYRWMGAAENGFRAQLEAASIDILAITVPLSVVLTAPEAELPEECREMRQLLFTFADNATLKEAQEGVVVGGDNPSRITRAHNGRNKGGSRGEDRKDFPAFIKSKLAHITSHLEHWDTMSAGQKDQVLQAFGQALGEWDTPVLGQVFNLFKKEMKNR